MCEARSKQLENSINDGIKRAIERVRMRSLAEPESDGEGEEEEELEDDEVRDDLLTEDIDKPENAIDQSNKGEQQIEEQKQE